MKTALAFTLLAIVATVAPKYLLAMVAVLLAILVFTPRR